MADLSKTIEIIFGASDQTGGVITNLGNDIRGLDSNIQAAAAPFGELADNVLKTTAALGAFGVAIAGLAVTAAGEFQGSVREIGSLFNATNDEIVGLGNTLQEYGRDSVATYQQILDASYIAISTGTNVEQVTETLTAAEQLAVAGATSLDAATGALSRSLNAYGAGAEEATRYSEALFVAVQKGDTTMDQLASNIGKVATIAATSGVSFEELLAALDGLTIAGISTAESTTKLRALFKELSDPSKELAAALGDTNIEADGLQGVMQKLQQVTGGSQTEMTALFKSVEAMTAALVLSNDAAGAFDGALTALEDKTGKLSAAYESMVNTFDNQNQRLVNNLKATLIEAGTPLLDDYGQVVEGFNEILKGLGEGVQAPNFQAIYASLDGLAVNLGDFLTDVGQALPEALAQLDFSGLTDALRELGVELGEVFGTVFGQGLDLTVPEDLAQVLQKVVNLITSLVQVSTGIIEELRPVFDFLGQAIDQVAGLDAELASTIGEFLGVLKLLADFGPILTGILLLLSETDQNLGQVLTNLGAGAQIIINAMQAAFDAFAVVVFKTAETLAKVGNLVTFGDVAQEFRDSAGELALLGDAAAANLDRNLGEMSDAWDKLNGVSTETTKSMVVDIDKAVIETKALNTELAQTTKELETAAEVELGLAKIASAERVEVEKLGVQLATISGQKYETKVKLDIAEAQSAVENLKTTFSSIDSTIQSTGDVLQTLFGVQPRDWVESLRVQDAVEQGQKIRSEAAYQQNQLIEAQVRYFDAKTQALDDGLAEITVSAEGLEPELEAFMWAILDRIKIRATQDQANFLLSSTI